MRNIQSSLLDSAEKPSFNPSTKLRANGNYIENIDDFPFMLSPSKHEKSFFSRIITPILQ